MKNNQTRRGFTLIELLVVVLIIGILAAIAVPQYNKAVMKSRFASLKPIAKSVKDAQEIYYNREGKYAGESELEDLDIGIPEGTSLDISATGEHQYVRVNNPAGLPHNSYTAYLDHSSNFGGNIYCEAYTGDANAEQLCVAEGGTAGPVNGEYTLYLLSGNSTGKFGSAGPQKTEGSSTHWPELFCNMYPCSFYTYDDGTVVDLWEISDNFVTVIVHDSAGNLIESGDYYADEMEAENSFSIFCAKYPGIERIGGHLCSEYL